MLHQALWSGKHAKSIGSSIFRSFVRLLPMLQLPRSDGAASAVMISRNQLRKSTVVKFGIHM